MPLLLITTTNKLSDFVHLHCSPETALEARVSDLIYTIAVLQRKEKPQQWVQKQMELELGLGLFESS